MIAICLLGQTIVDLVVVPESSTNTWIAVSEPQSEGPMCRPRSKPARRKQAPKTNWIRNLRRTLVEPSQKIGTNVALRTRSGPSLPGALVNAEVATATATHRAVAIDHGTKRSAHFVSDGAAQAATGPPGLRRIFFPRHLPTTDPQER